MAPLVLQSIGGIMTGSGFGQSGQGGQGVGFGHGLQGLGLEIHVKDLQQRTSTTGR